MCSQERRWHKNRCVCDKRKQKTEDEGEKEREGERGGRKVAPDSQGKFAQCQWPNLRRHRALFPAVAASVRNRGGEGKSRQLQVCVCRGVQRRAGAMFSHTLRILLRRQTTQRSCSHWRNRLPTLLLGRHNMERTIRQHHCVKELVEQQADHKPLHNFLVCCLLRHGGGRSSLSRPGTVC